MPAIVLFGISEAWSQSSFPAYNSPTSVPCIPFASHKKEKVSKTQTCARVTYLSSNGTSKILEPNSKNRSAPCIHGFSLPSLLVMKWIAWCKGHTFIPPSLYAEITVRGWHCTGKVTDFYLSNRDPFSSSRIKYDFQSNQYSSDPYDIYWLLIIWKYLVLVLGRWKFRGDSLGIPAWGKKPSADIPNGSRIV